MASIFRESGYEKKRIHIPAPKARRSLGAGISSCSCSRYPANVRHLLSKRDAAKLLRPWTQGGFWAAKCMFYFGRGFHEPEASSPQRRFRIAWCLNHGFSCMRPMCRSVCFEIGLLHLASRGLRSVLQTNAEPSSTPSMQPPSPKPKLRWQHPSSGLKFAIVEKDPERQSFSKKGWFRIGSHRRSWAANH
jgi:hypothetical protein